MKYFSVALLAVMAIPAAAESHFAPTAYLPPVQKDAATREAELFPLPRARAEAWIAAPAAQHVYADWAGWSDALKAEDADQRPLRVAMAIALNLDGAALFDTPRPEGTGWVHLASITSLDARALRFQVDLAGLAPDDELWVIEAAAARAHGPFTRANTASGAWLPTTMGDTAHLAVTSANASPPAVEVTRLHHYYRGLGKDDELPCPLPAACVDDPAFQTAATGVGRLFIPANSSAFLCTAALINDLESSEAPVMIGALHCFPDETRWDSLEVFWDFRATECGGAPPPENSVPRNLGAEPLAADLCLDAALFRLSEPAADGDQGRAWIGWTNEPLQVGNPVAGAHHPGGSQQDPGSGAQQGALGEVSRLDVSPSVAAFRRPNVRNQIRVVWNVAGTTQQGSSGSPLLLDTEDDYLITGMLSNGAEHRCNTPESNIDNYASFRHFFPAIRCHLGAGDCEADPDCSFEFEEPDNRRGCFAKAAMPEFPDALAGLRSFRDNTLAKSDVGRNLIDVYYAFSAERAHHAAADPEARAVITALALPFAAIGRWQAN